MFRKFLLFLFLSLLTFPLTVCANPPLQIDSPSVILTEQTTGRVLFAKNERERRYPASMTQLLTALLVVEYFNLDDVIIIGQEIRGMPAGFASNIPSEGEMVTVESLLHSMLIRNVNEAGRVFALNTVRWLEERENILYEEAERTFSVLLNEKAQALGAKGTHFNNPFGQHSENHFTTAYDIAIITRAFMDNHDLAKIVGTKTYEGGESTNQMLPNAPHGYAYIIGAKAGFTTPAGYVFAGAAYNNGLQLVSVTMGGTDAARWQDTRRLMDYGFNNFSFREIAQENAIVETVLIENPRLGDSGILEIVLSRSHSELLSQSEYTALSQKITYDPLLFVGTESEESILRAPIEDGSRVGTIAFTTGDIIIEIPVLASREVIERTFDSDMDYYLSRFFGGLFTRRALPYWFGFVGILIGVIGIFYAINTSRRAARGMNRTSRSSASNKKNKYNRYQNK
jgi:D-alanyl-D-alanine carboxypeptidase (penicillin-binding protein 5/6)